LNQLKHIHEKEIINANSAGCFLYINTKISRSEEACIKKNVRRSRM